MSSLTYGEHQEAAALALNRLIVSEGLPVAVQDIDHVLHCREIVVDALRQRLYTLGLDSAHPASSVPARLDNPRLDQLDRNLATVLDRLAFELPTLAIEERRAATDVLAYETMDLASRLWQEAAVELLAGSHALDAAADRSWLSDPGGGWYLIRDVAVALEAVLILDSRLDEVGLLQSHDRGDVQLDLDERRLVTSQCARVATWYVYPSPAVSLCRPITQSRSASPPPVSDTWATGEADSA